MKVLNTINTSNFNEQEKKIYQMLISHSEHLDTFTVKDIADFCYCSTASVNRLCKKIGVNGYLELKLLVRLARNESLLQYDVDDVDIKELDIFINALSKKKHLYIYGKGASEVSAMYLYRQLMKVGYPAQLVTDYSLLFNIQSENVLIISSSGLNRYSLRLAETSKRNNNKIYSITKKKSRLYYLSDYSLTHEVDVNLMHAIEKEQQIHLIKIINKLIGRLLNW